MMRFFLCALIACFSLAQMNAFGQNAEPKALLYKITGNGLDKPSYLYGTMHVSNKIAFNLADSFFLALKSVDMIALEINPDSFMNYSMKYDLNYVSPSVRYGTGAGHFYKDMSSSTEIDLDKMKSNLSDIDALSNFLLFRHRSITQNYEEGTYLDLFIFQTGKKLKKKISHVEDYNVTNELLAKSYQNDDDDESEFDFYDYDPDKKPIGDQIDDAYRNRDIDLIDSLDRVISSKNHYKYFIVERNKIQANSLVELMKEQSVFCGVGVAHLGGDSGVVNLLRLKGYTVTPVAQKSTKKSKKTFDKMSELEYPLVFSTFTAPDSVFSVSMPSETYTVIEDPSTVMYYCPEMVNGGYFQIVRMRTRESFTGMSNAERMQLIDSLMYEATPGKIIKKNEFNGPNGYAAMEVVSQTTIGNVIRAQIYVTPLEIIIFKARGVKEYAVEKNGNSFFNSIKFLPPKSETMKTYACRQAGVEVKIPANYVVSDLITSSARSLTPQVLSLEAFDMQGDRHFHFSLSDLHDFSYFETDTFELDAMLREFFKDLDIEDYSKKLDVKNGLPVIEGSASSKGRYYFARAELKGSRYALMTVSAPDSIVPRAFFDSFSWIPIQYKGEFTEDHDTIMHFRTTTILNDVNIFSRTLYNRTRSGFGFWGYSAEPDEEEIQTDGYSKRETYSSSETPEFVEVTFRRFARYTEMDSTKKDFMDFSYDTDDMVRKTLSERTQGDMKEVVYMFTDTAVSRAIYVKNIVKGGALYTVKAMADSTEGLTGWTKAFFDHFRPDDTTFGRSVFADKGSLYLSDLMSSDSLVREIAEKADPFLVFDTACSDALIHYMKSPEFKALKGDDKSEIIDRIGKIPDIELTDILVNLYRNSEDSVELQHSILSGLASQRTKESFAALLSMMEFDTPLADDYESFTDIYYPLFDSLSLTKELFPALLVYTRYDEHKKPIYALLLTLVDHGIVDKKMIADHYRSILAEANDEFKRMKMDGSMSSWEMRMFLDYFESLDSDDDATEVDSARLKELEYASSPLLEVLMELLAVDYLKNQQSVNYFNKVLKSKRPDLVLTTMVLMEKNKITTPDSLWTMLSTKAQVVRQVYTELEKKKALHLMDSASNTQQFFAFSYFYDAEEEEDSVVFLKRVEAEVLGEKGYVYFFKSKQSYGNSWYLSYAGPYPLDGSIIKNPELIVHSGGKVSKKSDGTKEIEKEMEDFYYHNRERAKGGYGYFFGF